MDTYIIPAPLSGTVAAIASKSDAHRALICAALSDAPTDIEIATSSKDIDATADCLKALGAKITRKEGVFHVEPITQVRPAPVLDCSESGSTLRFMLPVAAVTAPKASFLGHGRLPERPIKELADEMKRHGVSFDRDKLPFTISGCLGPGDFYLPGNVSSQYITGLLLALPHLSARSEIHLTSKLESTSYVSMTLSSLRRFGVKILPSVDGYIIPSSASYRSPGRLRTDADWSNAAFFLTAGAVSGPVTVTGLDLRSNQGDKAILDCLEAFGAELDIQERAITVSGGQLHGAWFDLHDIPDLLPALAVVATRAEGKTVFANGSRLRIKESDRLSAVADMIRSLGGIAHETSDGIVIEGHPLHGGTVNGYNDHRIVMASAIAASIASGPVTITGSQAVNKSYPGFWQDFSSLGGNQHVK